MSITDNLLRDLLCSCEYFCLFRVLTFGVGFRSVLIYLRALSARPSLEDKYNLLVGLSLISILPRLFLRYFLAALLWDNIGPGVPFQ